MVEKTLRFPGHIQKIIKMQNNGDFYKNRIKQTSSMLIKKWYPDENDYDQTVMRLEFNGEKDRKKITETYDLLDYFDYKNNISSIKLFEKFGFLLINQKEDFNTYELAN